MKFQNTEANCKPIGQFVGFVVFILLLFVYQAFCCGAPQQVSGSLVASDVFELMSLKRAVVSLESSAENEPVRYARANAFGFYYFESVAPCTEYVVRAQFLDANSLTFAPQSRLVYVVGDAPSLDVNFEIVSSSEVTK